MVEKISKIRGVRYSWKESSPMYNKDKPMDDIGFIAQDVLEIVPEVVHLEGDTYTIEYDKMVVLAIGSIQEQQTRLNYLSEKIKTYKKLLNNG